MQKLTIVLFFITTTVAIAAPDLSQLDTWTAENKENTFETSFLDKVIAENTKYFVVRQDAGTSCATGSYWLFNKEKKSYSSVDSGTCDDRKFKVSLNPNKLVFMSRKKIAAQYPLY